jgi:hypothetical protein
MRVRQEAGRDTRYRDRVLLGAVAVLLIACQFVMARLSPGWTQASFTTLVSAAPVVLLLAVPALAGLLAIPALTRTTRSSLVLMGAVLLTGLAMRVVWYGVPIEIDDDYFRYLWDGAVLAAGHDPYALPPLAAMRGTSAAAHLASLAERGAAILPRINFPELSTIYPGTSQLAFAVAAWFAPFDPDGLRAVFLLAELTALAILAVVFRETGHAPALAALFWLNPIVVWSSHGTIHSEALMPPLLLGAVLLLWRGRDVWAAVLLALAIGVKLWPVLLVPLFALHVWRQARSLVRPTVVGAVVVAILVAPLALAAARNSHAGLSAYAQHWWVNNAPFAWASYAVYHATDGALWGQRTLRALIAVATVAIALRLAWRAQATLQSLLLAATLTAATVFYLAPAQFPWYALWFLPLAAAIPCPPLLLASVTLPVYYLFLPLVNQGSGEIHNYGVALLHAALVWVWLAADAWRRRRPTHDAAA